MKCQEFSRISTHVNGYPLNLAFGNKKLYVAKSDSNNISVLDTSTGSMEPRTYKVDHIPNDISVINSTLYIANKNFNNVSVFENEGDRLKSKPDIKVGEPQISLETDGNKTLYVLHQNGKSEGKLSIIRVDENRIGNVHKRLPVGMSPKDVKYDVKFKKIYVTNSGSDSVSIIYPAKNFSVKNLDVGLQPRDITIDARTGNVLVVNQAQNQFL